MKHGRGYVYDLYYHIVWCVKYRHKILVDDVKDDFIDIITNICINNNYELVELQKPGGFWNRGWGSSPEPHNPTSRTNWMGESTVSLVGDGPGASLSGIMARGSGVCSSMLTSSWCWDSSRPVESDPRKARCSRNLGSD